MTAPSAGTAYVEIRPDFDALTRELREKAAAIHRNPATMKVDADTRGLDHKLEQTRKRAAGILAGAAAVAAGGLTAALFKTVDAARESEVSQAKLEAQLKASGISYREHAKEIDRVIQKTARLAAVDDEDLQDAFTNVVRSTGDVGGSLREMGTVADVARAKHLDLAAAGALVGKVMVGNVTPLKRLGIVLDPVTTATDRLKATTKHATDEQKAAAKAADKHATALNGLNLLQKRFAGQAEAYGKTSSGAIDRAKNAVENLEESIGSALAPTIAKAANHIAKFVDQMREGRGAGGRFAHQLGEVAHKAEDIGKFLARHKELIAIAVGAWATYRLAVKTALEIDTLTKLFRRLFARSVPVAYAEGAAAGEAYSAGFAAGSAGTGAGGPGGIIRGGRGPGGIGGGLLRAALPIGVYYGLVGSQNDQFSSPLADELSRFALRDQRGGGGRIIQHGNNLGELSRQLQAAMDRGDKAAMRRIAGQVRAAATGPNRVALLSLAAQIEGLAGAGDHFATGGNEAGITHPAVQRAKDAADQILKNHQTTSRDATTGSGNAARLVDGTGESDRERRVRRRAVDALEQAINDMTAARAVHHAALDAARAAIKPGPDAPDRHGAIRDLGIDKFGDVGMSYSRLRTASRAGIAQPDRPPEVHLNTTINIETESSDAQHLAVKIRREIEREHGRALAREIARRGDR